PSVARDCGASRVAQPRRSGGRTTALFSLGRRLVSTVPMIRIARAPFASPRRQGGLGVRATAARPRFEPCYRIACLPTSNRETAVGKVATPEATRDELITTECGLGIGAVHAAQGNGKPRPSCLRTLSQRRGQALGCISMKKTIACANRTHTGAYQHRSPHFGGDQKRRAPGRTRAPLPGTCAAREGAKSRARTCLPA